MTARQVYEAILIEMNKVQAPSILLEDFNYLFNKAIFTYINKRYNIYDINLLTTDDLRVLKSTAMLPVKKSTIYGADPNSVIALHSLYGATYEVNLPLDYLHLLNCICDYKVAKQFKCYDKDTHVLFKANRLTSDMWGEVINNFYMKPSYKKPYYFLHNVNTRNDGGLPTNPYRTEDMQSTGFGTGTDILVSTLYDIFVDFKENHQSYEFSVKEGIVSAYVDEETLTPYKSKYYVASKDGIDYLVVFNWSKKEFELILDSNVTLNYDSETAVVITTGTNIRVLDETLIINDLPTTLNKILATPDFIDRIRFSKSEIGLPTTINNDIFGDIDLVEKNAVHRYGNASNVRLEIRYGKDDALFQLLYVYIDYIKSPQYIRLTQEQIDRVEDTSLIMEFPDYVCQEIINELTHIMQENASDPRLLTHLPLSQSIANPAQQLEQPKK